MFVTIATGGDQNAIRMKLLTSSLLRSLIRGKIVLIGNVEAPIYRVERKHISEINIHSSPFGGDSHQQIGAEKELVFDLARYLDPVPGHWVVVASNAGIALRNTDHLLAPLSVFGDDSHVDLYWTATDEIGKLRSLHRASPGLFAVRGEHLATVLTCWREHWIRLRGECNDEQIWTEVVRALPIRTSSFERGEVYAPRIGAVDWDVVSNAAFVTVPDWPEKEQWKFLQSLYFGTYFGDETGLMLNILEP